MDQPGGTRPCWLAQHIAADRNRSVLADQSMWSRKRRREQWCVFYTPSSLPHLLPFVLLFVLLLSSPLHLLSPPPTPFHPPLYPSFFSPSYFSSSPSPSPLSSSLLMKVVANVHRRSPAIHPAGCSICLLSGPCGTGLNLL